MVWYKKYYNRQLISYYLLYRNLVVILGKKTHTLSNRLIIIPKMLFDFAFFSFHYENVSYNVFVPFLSHRNIVLFLLPLSIPIKILSEDDTTFGLEIFSKLLTTEVVYEKAPIYFQ